MITRKLTIGVMAALYGAATAHAADTSSQRFLYKPFGQAPISEAVVPDWEVVSQQFTPWVNDGNVYNCSAWTPPVNLVNLDEDFTQTRTCSQSQARTRVDELYSERLKQTRYEGPFGESHVISVEESQSATGTRDFITGVREDSWPLWERVGGYYDCGDWSPDPSSVDYGTDFTQDRDCSWDEGRYRDVFNTWQSGIETYLRTDSDARTVPYTDTRPSVGTYRDWQPTSSTFTSWIDVGADYAHLSWTPSPVAQTSSFSQSRDYKRDQERFEQFREQDRITSDIRNSGDPVLRSQTVGRSDARAVTVTVGGYSNLSTNSYSAYSPSYGNQTSNYTQHRTYNQVQRRVWYYKVGSSTIHTRNEDRTLTGQSQSRTVTVTNAVGGYGSNYGHSSWSPDPNTQTSTFTQTRSYKRNRTRTYTQKVGATTVRTFGVTETGNFSESRSVTVSWSGWSNNGAASCGGWVQNSSTGAKTRSCYQPEKRTRYYKSGTTTIRSATETRNRSYTDSVTVTGVTYGGWSGYSNNGSYHSCSGYSPSPGTVAKGSSFTQSRTCTQPQRRSRAKYNTLSDGSNFRTGTDYGYRNITVTQYKYNVSGTKIVEQCSSGGIDYSSNVGYENGDYCDVEQESWRFNGVKVYDYEFSDCGSGYERVWSINDGYNYTTKNWNGSTGDVCRTPK